MDGMAFYRSNLLAALEDGTESGVRSDVSVHRNILSPELFLEEVFRSWLPPGSPRFRQENLSMNKPTPHEIYINGLSQAIHQDCVNVGWWDDPDRCIFICLQLVSTEIAEATEGCRKNLMDTHLPYYKMEEVEYADALIRVLDLGGKLELHYRPDEAITHRWCNVTRSIGQQHLGVNSRILDMASAYRDYEIDPSDIHYQILQHTYNDLIISIIQVAKNRGYDLFLALEDKMAYNRTRLDHKREERAKPGGKSW